jgi:hypothetical protein
VFARGLICECKSHKVVTLSDNIGRITIIQPGKRKWITTIECVNSMGHIIPLFEVLDGKNHLKSWFDEQQILPDINVGVSPNE